MPTCKQCNSNNSPTDDNGICVECEAWNDLEGAAQDEREYMEYIEQEYEYEMMLTFMQDECRRMWE